MQRYFLYLAYDGTSYHGWQIQPNGISVQEVLQKALATLLRQPVSITGAGRTDTGVHARMMVAHFDFEYADDPVRRIDGRWLTDKLNRLLPPDISIYKTVPVAGQPMHMPVSMPCRAPTIITCISASPRSCGLIPAVCTRCLILGR